MENNLKTEFELSQDNTNIYIKENLFAFDKTDKIFTNYIINKNKFLEKLIYQNLETSILKQIKNLVEEELAKRA